MSDIESILSSIRGIGPKTATALALKLNSLTPSISNPTPQTIRSKLLTSGIPLKNDTLIDLKYNPLEKIPRSVIASLEKELEDMAFGSSKTADILGSYVRGAETSGDVDILLTGIDTTTFISQLNADSKKFKLLEPYALGEAKASTLLAFKERGSTKHAWCDIFTTTPKEKVFATTYLIGNVIFNIHMRQAAKKLGYLLNQHGLFRDGKSVDVSSEKKLFDILNVPWCEPNERSY